MAGAEPGEAELSGLAKMAAGGQPSAVGLETGVECGAEKSRWEAGISARLAQIEAENGNLARELAENEEYEKKLEGFKRMLPAIGVGPMPQAEVQALRKSSIENPLGWPAQIHAELARIDTQNKKIAKKLSESESLKKKLDETRAGTRT